MDPHGPPPSLLDRDREMEIVRGLLAQVRSRSPAAIFVEGEPGIGKSSLFAAALREATGFAVFTAFSQELLKDRPFAPLAEALRIDPRSKDPRRAEVAGLLRAGDGRGPPAPGPELRFQIVDAIVGLVEQAATRGPVLLGLEDIHWADDATLLTLDRLIRETRGLPLMVMSTLRPAPHIQALERLIARSSVSATRVELGPLGREAIVVLANALAGAPPGPRLMDVVSEAGGNPLFVHELIGTMRDEGAISIQSGRAEVSMISMPPPLRMTIIHHLAALPSETAALLRTASILGSSLRPTHLGTVLDRKVSDLTTELRSAVESGILISDQDRLTFRHELVREAIYLDIPEAVRRALHLEAARALARAGAPADEVAYHYAQGAERGDHDAADWITEAARRAAPLSPDAATGLYRRALELIHDHHERKQVLAELAETLLWSGRLAEAGIVAEEALDTASPSAVSRRLRGSLARASLMQGQVGAAREHLRAASMSAGTEGDERGRFESEEALISLFSGDLAGAIEKATALRATAESLGDDRLRCETLVVLGLAAFFSARVHEGVELLRESLDPSIRRPDVLRWAPHVFLGTALIELDALKDAETVLIEGLRFSERMGMGWPSGFYRTQIGLQHFVGGRWVLAAEELSLAVSDPLSNPGLTVFPRAMLATMAVHRGDVDDARAHLKAAGEAAGSGSSFGIDVMMWGQSMLLNATSGPSDGRQVLESAWQINESLGFISQCIRIGPDLVRLAIATDDRALARSVSEVMRDAAARNPVASWRGAALLCRGLGDDDTDVLARSIAVYRTSPRPVEFAFACLDVAAVFIRTGTDGAAEIVHEALEVLEPLNLRPHVARADSLLRSLGIKRGRRDRRGRPAEGWESLTETEFAVVELAAEGLTNPEIGRRLYISRRTVESHLSHAFAKLGLSSRVQLAAEAARRGMRSPPVPDER